MGNVKTKIESYVVGRKTTSSKIVLPPISDDCLTNEEFNQTQETWDGLLRDIIHTGQTRSNIQTSLVDYEFLIQNENYLSRYEECLNMLQGMKIENLNFEQRKALFINAYNISAVKVILDYRIEHQIFPNSIMKIHGNDIWDDIVTNIAGTDYALNSIEHGILRHMDDHRIHSAIVCSSLSCPDLRGEAFCAGRLDEQLEEQMTNWINHETKGCRIQKNTVYISRIFLWFESDFKPNVQKVLQNYSSEVNSTKDLEIKYWDYDWNLNIFQENNEKETEENDDDKKPDNCLGCV